MFSNLKELLALVPDLNLADDPRIKQVARQAAALANEDRDYVAGVARKRKECADEANRLLSIFGPK